MSNLDGKIICGWRNGDGFKDVIRPDVDSLTCPEGTVACSPATSPENTVCYHPLEIAEVCPITDIKFMQKTENWADFLESTDSTALLFKDDLYLVYSKGQTDNLPITTGTLSEYQPCIDPADSENHGSFYPTEIGRLNPNCDLTNGFTYDMRYTNAGGPNISLFDLQNASGVLDILQSM